SSFCGRFVCRWSGLTCSRTAHSLSSNPSSSRPAIAMAASAGARGTFPLTPAARRVEAAGPFAASTPRRSSARIQRRPRRSFPAMPAIQRAIDGRATMRLDANRAYTQAAACRFAAALDPSGIELFEQPCAAEDWDANAKVAKVSTVPIMLDEPICAPSDIERAAEIRNVGFCKLKLKRFGGLDLLKEALEKVRQYGMEPVLGDGLSSELGCWMEA